MIISLAFFATNLQAKVEAFQTPTLRSGLPLVFDPTPIVDYEVDKENQKVYALVRFPNSCYQPWSSFKKLEGNEIYLYHVATFPKGQVCDRMIEHYETSFDIESIEPGTYELIDGDRNIELGEVKISDQD